MSFNILLFNNDVYVPIYYIQDIIVFLANVPMTKHEDDKVWLHQAKNTLQMKTHYTSPKQNGIHNQPMETSIAFFKDMICFWFQKKKY